MDVLQSVDTNSPRVPRRRCCSSPGLAGRRKSRKKARFLYSNRPASKSCTFESGSLLNVSLESISKSCEIDHFSCASPRDSQAPDNGSPPPTAEKIMRMMDRFKIESPALSRSKSYNDRNTSRRLYRVSQLPRSMDPIDSSGFSTSPSPFKQSPNQGSTPPPVPATGGAMDLDTTPVSEAAQAGGVTYTTPENEVAKAFFVTPDPSEPTMPPSWGLGGSGGRTSKHSFPMPSIKDHFAVSKSPFRRAKNATFDSPCLQPTLRQSRTPAASSYHGTPVASAYQGTPAPSATKGVPGTQQRVRRGSKSSLVAQASSCVKEELTPSTAKMKIMPTRPGKCRLRRQRSLRMASVGTGLGNAARQAREESTRETKLKRRATFAGMTALNRRDWCAKDMRNLAKNMKRAGVCVLALDWDNTTIGCHTQSNWYGTAAELEKHIRPKCRSLVHAAHKQGIRLSVVTFSEQERLVRQVLKIAFPNIEGGPTPFIIRGNGGGWTCVNEPPACIPAEMRKKGKIPHLLSTIEALPPCQNGIGPRQVVLIDDDHENVTSAMECNFHSFIMDPDSPQRVYDSMKVIFSGAE